MARKTYIDSRGYMRFKNSHKPVHRWVAEKKLRRKLRPGEVVHHKDRDKLNNHPANLWVFPNQAAHDRAHRYDAERFGKDYSYKGYSGNDNWDGWGFESDDDWEDIEDWDDDYY